MPVIKLRDIINKEVNSILNEGMSPGAVKEYQTACDVRDKYRSTHSSDKNWIGLNSSILLYDDLMNENGTTFSYRIDNYTWAKNALNFLNRDNAPGMGPLNNLLDNQTRALRKYNDALDSGEYDDDDDDYDDEYDESVSSRGSVLKEHMTTSPEEWGRIPTSECEYGDALWRRYFSYALENITYYLDLFNKSLAKPSVSNTNKTTTTSNSVGGSTKLNRNTMLMRNIQQDITTIIKKIIPRAPWGDRIAEQMLSIISGELDDIKKADCIYQTSSPHKDYEIIEALIAKGYIQEFRKGRYVYLKSALK